MYPMLRTRPNLAFTVPTLSKYCLNPAPKHVRAIKRTLRYLQGTKYVGLAYRGQENPAVLEAVGGPIISGISSFTDSDWAEDKDSRKSTFRYVFLLYGGAISWKSTKQNVVATSSTKAEYISCSEAVKKALWICRLKAEIRSANTTTIPTGI
jgi:hypothetical protein